MYQRFRELINFTVEMGNYAKMNQSMIHRSLKADGSFVTETDISINANMIQKISNLYPEANIVTEENDDTPFNFDAPLTFVVDPIDGTTAYSRGMANWAVSIGILDKNRKAIGAIIYLPRYGNCTDSSLFYREPNTDVIYLNEAPFEISMEGRDEIHDMITGDKTWKHITFPFGFECKMRSLCSSVIDMLSQILFIDFAATINDAGCYAWDIAGTDAILSAYGIQTVLSNGCQNLYTDEHIVERKPYNLPVYAATKDVLRFMVENFKVNL